MVQKLIVRGFSTDKWAAAEAKKETEENTLKIF